MNKHTNRDAEYERELQDIKLPESFRQNSAYCIKLKHYTEQYAYKGSHVAIKDLLCMNRCPQFGSADFEKLMNIIDRDNRNSRLLEEYIKRQFAKIYGTDHLETLDFHTSFYIEEKKRYFNTQPDGELLYILCYAMMKERECFKLNEENQMLKDEIIAKVNGNVDVPKVEILPEDLPSLNE